MAKLTYFIHWMTLLLYLIIEIDAINFGISYNTSEIFNDTVEFTCFYESSERVSLEWKWDADYAGISLFGVQPQTQSNGIATRILRLRSNGAKAGPYRCTASTNITTSYANAIYNKDRDIQPVQPFVVSSIRESVTLKVVTSLSGQFKWFRRGQEVTSSNSINIQNSGKDIVFSSADAFNSGMYKCESTTAVRNAWVNLVIQACPSGKYSTSRDRCDGICQCFNGGICDASDGRCICSPGFTGDRCEIICPVGYFGHKCSQRCLKGSCNGQVVCAKSPGGCTCVTGWQGNNCTAPCTQGNYGAGCQLACDCPNGVSCNNINGACPNTAANIIRRDSTTKLDIKEGQIATLRCFASGSPIPNITWSKNNQDIVNSSSIYMWQAYHKLLVRVSYLRIPRTSISDTATYTCIASNGILNPNRHDITLNVSSMTVRPITTATPSTTASTNAIGMTTRAITNAPVQTAGTISSEWCPSMFILGIRWDRTLIGRVNSKPCPSGTTGTASWYCHSSDYWHKSWPDLSQCKSSWLTNLRNQVNRSDSNNTLAAASLRINTGLSRPIYGGDVIAIIELCNQLLIKERDEIKRTGKTSLVNNFIKELIESSSNLIDPLHYSGWVGLKQAQRIALATKLMRIIDDIMHFWSNNTGILTNTNITIISNNVVAIGAKMRTNVATSISFPLVNNPISFASTLRFNLPLAASIVVADTQVAYVAYKRLSDLLATYVPGIDDKIKNSTNVVNNQKILGGIISVSTRPFLSSGFLEANPVTYTIRYTQTADNDGEKRCAYWDFSPSRAQGIWNSRGCSVAIFNSTHITCRCNHMTTFSAVETIRINQISQNLKDITVIGCAIATATIVAVLLILFSFRSQNMFMNHIRLNTLFTLFVFELLYLFSIYRTRNKDVCFAMAVCIDFFSLCTFFWIFVSSFEIYRRTFHIMESLKKIYCYLFAYTLPGITVLISAFASSGDFGTNNFCWLKIGGGAFWLFVGEVLLLVVASVIMCSRVMHEVSMRRRSEQENIVGNPRLLAQGSLLSIFLLVATWTFAILYMREISTIMAVLYLILNSSLGIFLFIFYAVLTGPMNKNCAQFWQSQIMGTSGTIKFASTRRTTSSRDAASTDDKATYVDRNVAETFHDVKRPYTFYEPNSNSSNNRFSKENGNNKSTNL